MNDIGQSYAGIRLREVEFKHRRPYLSSGNFGMLACDERFTFVKTRVAPPFLFAGLALMATLGLAIWLESHRGFTSLDGATTVPTVARTDANQGLTVDDHPDIVKIFLRDQADLDRLVAIGVELHEKRGSDFVWATTTISLIQKLRAQGFEVETPTGDASIAPVSNSNAGYHSLSEIGAHMDELMVKNPSLVRNVVYGISWRKARNPADGYDLKTMCITNRRPGDCTLNPNTNKPRFLLMAAVHPRELATSEMAMRWMDYLLSGYGTDPEVTALLDSSEIWVIPVANPDGKALVDSGAGQPMSQRKNADTSRVINTEIAGATCDLSPTAASWNLAGVDLNRNASFRWGLAGSSANPCSAFYRGQAPASEPEEQALESLMRALFRDQRNESGLTSAAPLTTTGVMISLHSYGNLLLIPFLSAKCQYQQPCPAIERAPNDAGLRTLGFRMAYYNQFAVGQAPEIMYQASGTQDDWAYATLGVASYTFEVGADPDGQPCSGFTPIYSCNDSVFWPALRPALLYAAKAARQPYAIPSGPTVTAVSAIASPSGTGALVSVTVSLADDALGSVGFSRPEPKSLDRVEIYLDQPPWQSPRPAMTGSLSALNTLSLTLIIAGNQPVTTTQRTLFVRGCNVAGACGPSTALWIKAESHAQ